MDLNFLIMLLSFVMRGKGTKCFLGNITSPAISSGVLIYQDSKSLEIKLRPKVNSCLLLESALMCYTITKSHPNRTFQSSTLLSTKTTHETSHLRKTRQVKQIMRPF